MALEAIELIIHEKAIQENSSDLNSSASRALVAGSWRKCRSIYNQMSHHYIQRRSVVFIVDTQFDSVVYRDKALKYVEKFYSKLDRQDHFGYISLNSPQDMTKDEIRLEHCKKNKRLKEKIIADIAKREIEYVFNYEEGHR